MPKTRVLVVGAESASLKLAERFLTLEGFETEVTNDVAQALICLERAPFDLLLADVQTPPLSGLSMIQHAKLRRPHIRVILLMQGGTVSSGIAASQAGASGYILKPFTQQALRWTLQNALKRDRLRRENLWMKSLMSLSQFSQMLTLGNDLPALLMHIVRWILEETRVDGVSLLLLDKQRDVLTPVAGVGRLEAGSSRSGGIARLALEKGEPILIQGTTAQTLCGETPVDPDTTASLWTYPISLHKQAIAVIQLYSATHPLCETDQTLVSISCKQAIVAIENARLYQSVTENSLQKLRAIMTAIELKDTYRKGHATGGSDTPYGLPKSSP